RIPNEGFQLASTGLVELHAFPLEHSLLLVGRQNDPRCRTSPLRIDHAMPRRLIVSAVHDKTDRPRRVTFAELVCDLPVRHYPTARDATHNLVNAFAIMSDKLQLVVCFHKDLSDKLNL